MSSFLILVMAHALQHGLLPQQEATVQHRIVFRFKPVTVFVFRPVRGHLGHQVSETARGRLAFFRPVDWQAAQISEALAESIEVGKVLCSSPVVNVGNRQKGRARAGNVIDTGYPADEILAAIARALSS